MKDLHKIETAIVKLDQWIESNGWAGYDPYDIKDKSLIRKITDWGNRYYIIEIFREGIFELFKMFPVISRKILNVRPAINAKGMGLLAKAYYELFTVYKEESYRLKSEECITWLDNNFNKNFPGKGWGYPFNWQAQELIPQYTPNGIVTTAVGEAYWTLYKATGEDKYIEVCKDICTFLVSLPIDKIDDTQICFSYTPVFVNHIHNLNLFIAEFLIKIGNEIDNHDWYELGIKAANYTINNQSDDGTFDYNGPPDPPRNLCDNYHTAFVMRMLYSIWLITDRKEYFQSLNKCYNHYINNFFEDDCIPKFTPTRKYRIDIHSSAEAINCLCELAPHFPAGVALAYKIANWTIDHLQDTKGYFYHGFFKSRITGTTFISKIPYMRWGQAWMLVGLSTLSKTLKNTEDNNSFS